MCCFLCLAKNSIQEYVDAHNKARAEVGVPPLKWNDTIAEYAMNFAKSKIDTCVIEPSGGPYGENTASFPYDNVTPTKVVDTWLHQKLEYNYTANNCTAGLYCGNYKQVVWRDTVHLGCAKSNWTKCDNNWYFFVCNYDPPANLEGGRPY
jgi:pathogenesis-related protein 1